MSRRVISGLIASSMLIAAAAAWWMTPAPYSLVLARLTDIVPKSFQDWSEVESAVAPVDPTTGRGDARDTNSPYDDVLMRAYMNQRGDVVFLALAYGRSQHQEVKIHRPDLCYVAQGFKLVRQSAAVFPAEGVARPAAGKRMLVQSLGRVEAVSYWIRIGQIYSQNAWRTRYYIFRQGLRGTQPDGILVRVSQIVPSVADATDARYRVQEQFLADLVRAMPANSRGVLVAEAQDDG